ncbi:MAG: TetR/AcrR family transcriptional regulator [Pseudomonadota bacterium]
MGRPRGKTDEQIVVAARRCFLARGISVSAAEIANELGVSHTTLFNRFGSKEGLLIAALAPPEKVAWIADLESGPDERPIQTQLVEHVRVIASYFREVYVGLGLLQAAGIDPTKACEQTRADHAAPEQAFRAVVSWLQQAQEQGRLAECDVETVASSILGSLHGHAFITQLRGMANALPASDEYVERFVSVLWRGIGV